MIKLPSRLVFATVHGSYILLVTIVGVFGFQPGLSALTAQERRNYTNMDISFIDSPCVDPLLATPGGIITPDQEQARNAKTIIGVAKTMNLSKKAALIAFMTAYQESHFTNYGNDGSNGGGATIKTLSETNPNFSGFPAVSDHDSVGVFQQRPLAGWSTFDTSAITKDTVWQIMGSVRSDQAVAYSAQAFFGSPVGAALPDGLPNPGALKKGLLNKVPNYDSPSVQPGVAAQTVQVSAFPDAYNKWQEQAGNLVDQYWNDAPAVPLPVPYSGGVVATPNTSCSISITGHSDAVNRILSKIAEYAWPDYRRAGSSNAVEKKPQYETAVRRGGYNGDTCYGGGVDCGAFVTHVMRDSGVDPDYNKGNQATDGQLRYLNDYSVGNNKGNAPKYQKVPLSEPLQPGDIAVKDGHTWMWVDGAIPGFHGVAASASQCERAPMAGPADTRSEYEWFRIL